MEVVLSHIHPTAIVDKKAELADNVTVGPYSIIEGGVTIGEGTEIGPHCYIDTGTSLGKNNRISPSVVLGTWPQDHRYDGAEKKLLIGDDNVIREHCYFNRGMHTDRTVVGDHNFIMGYSHVAHDCRVGSHIIIANGMQMAGHVEIEDYVNIGGIVPIHQFCKIGQHAFIGAGFRIAQDVPPYIMAAGCPIGYKGVNVIGLRRRGFSSEAIDRLRRVYRFIYRSKLNKTQALERIRAEVESTPEVEIVLDFIERSERGLIG